jgi:hypothetical protein
MSMHFTYIMFTDGRFFFALFHVTTWMDRNVKTINYHYCRLTQTRLLREFEKNLKGN